MPTSKILATILALALVLPVMAHGAPESARKVCPLGQEHVFLAFHIIDQKSPMGTMGNAFFCYYAGMVDTTEGLLSVQDQLARELKQKIVIINYKVLKDSPQNGPNPISAK